MIPLTEEEIEAKEHSDVLLALRDITHLPQVRTLLKYLFKSFDVGNPPYDLSGDELHQYLGHMKAGSSIFKLVSQADVKTAGELLAQVEKERYDKEYLRSLADDEARRKERDE